MDTESLNLKLFTTRQNKTNVAAHSVKQTNHNVIYQKYLIKIKKFLMENTFSLRTYLY